MFFTRTKTSHMWVPNIGEMRLILYLNKTFGLKKMLNTKILNLTLSYSLIENVLIYYC